MQPVFFPNKQQNLQPECADTQVHVEGRKVKQKDFHLCALRTLQCTVVCGCMGSIRVSSSSALLQGLSNVWIVTGWLGWLLEEKHSKKHWSGFVLWLQVALIFLTYFITFLLIKCHVAYIWHPCSLVWLLYFQCKDSFSGLGSCSGRHLSVRCVCTLNFEDCSAKVNQGEIRKEDRLGPHLRL